MRAISKPVLLVMCVAAFAACETAPKSLYHWETFDRSTHNVLKDPDKVDLTVEIRALSGEIEKDRIEGRRAAPGAHAHLGYLYFLSGNPASAKIEFEAERELYPESAVFIDGVLKRLQT